MVDELCRSDFAGLVRIAASDQRPAIDNCSSNLVGLVKHRSDSDGLLSNAAAAAR